MYPRWNQRSRENSCCARGLRLPCRRLLPRRAVASSLDVCEAIECVHVGGNHGCDTFGGVLRLLALAPQNLRASGGGVVGVCRCGGVIGGRWVATGAVSGAGAGADAGGEGVAINMPSSMIVLGETAAFGSTTTVTTKASSSGYTRGIGWMAVLLLLRVR